MSNEDLEQPNSETGQEEESNSETGQQAEQTDSQQQSGQDTGSQQDSQDQGQKDSNSQLYARAKKAEEELKKERAKTASYEQQEKVEKKFSEQQDPVELAKSVQVLKDYSPEELDVIKQQSQALGVSPVEAAQNEDVQAIIEKRREKKEVEESNPTPTNRQEPPSEDFSQWTPETVEKKFKENTEEARKQIDEYYKWLKQGR